MTKLSVYDRAIDPFKDLYVICENIVILGHNFVFGDRLSAHTSIMHNHTHFSNGVLGTLEEFEGLDGKPVEIIDPQDVLQPRAIFVVFPDRDKAPLDAPDLEKFYVENLKLLKSADKEDILGYAKACGITIEDPKPTAKKDSIIKSIIAKAQEMNLIEE